MIEILAKVLILPRDKTYFFVDGWDFEVGNFMFSKLSDHELEVTFKYESDLTCEDETFGRVRESPHDLSEDLLKKEYELDILLDVITLQTGAGLRIDYGSYKFIYSGGSNSSSSKREISIYDQKSISDRFDKTLTADDITQDILRFYRLNRLELDKGERISQLWNIIERLYGKQPSEHFLNKEELSLIKEFVENSNDIDESKKSKLLEGISYINPINTLELMADRIKLKDEKGPISNSKKKKMLKEWKELRGKQNHGIYLVRCEGLIDILWDLEDMAELFLEEKIRPKMYLVIVFKNGSLSDGWKKTPSHYVIGDWNFTPMRGSNIAYEANVLKNVVMGDVPVYIFDYKSIYKILPHTSELISITDTDEVLEKEISNVQSKMIDN
jgi:hypothetical protein